MSADMFDVVRKHLLETNAMEEAEELLLRHMIQQSETKGKARERRASMPSADFTKEKSEVKLVDSIDALKVSDLLGSIERVMEPVKPVKTKGVRPITPEAPPIQREVSLDTLERLAEEEIFRLEQQKREVQRKLEDKRAQAERERILAERAMQQAAAHTPQHIKQEAFDAGSRLQKKLQELNTHHQEVVSEHKRHSLEAERELQLISQGRWNPATSSLLSSVLRPNQSNSTYSTRESNQEHTSLSEELLRKSRVKELLAAVQTEDSIAARQKRIAQLRDKQQQIQDIEDRAVRQKDQRPASPPLVLNRSEPVHVSLDKWLQSGDAVASNSAHGQETRGQKEVDLSYLVKSQNAGQARNPTSSHPSPVVSVSQSAALAPVDTMVEQELARLREENLRLKTQLESSPPREATIRNALQPPSDPPALHPMMAPAQQIQPAPYPTAYNPSFPFPASQPHPMQAFQPAQYPYQQPFPYPPMGGMGVGGVDPTQQQLLQQMQQIYQQIEQENKSLQSLAQPTSNAPQPALPLVHDIHSLPPSLHDGNMGEYGGLHNAPIPISNASHPNAPLSRREAKQQEELRSIQYEIEKLRYMKEYEELKISMDKEKKLREEEEKHKSWLEEQKRYLQTMKMQQIIAKEQQMLALQNSPEKGAGDLQGGRNKYQNASISSLYNIIKEEAGVGGAAGGAGLPMENGVASVNEITVIVDAVSITHSYLTSVLPSISSSISSNGVLYRVIMGVYDGAGNTLNQNVASNWHIYTPPPIANTNSNTNISNRHASSKQSGRAHGGGSQVQYLEIPCVLPISLPLEYIEASRLHNLKILFELQIKLPGPTATSTGIQKSLGWSLCSVFNANKMYMFNNCWSLSMKEGISNPKAEVGSFVSGGVAVGVMGGGDMKGSLLYIRIGASKAIKKDWNLEEVISAAQNISLNKLYTLMHTKDFIDQYVNQTATNTLLEDLLEGSTKVVQPPATPAAPSLNHVPSLASMSSGGGVSPSTKPLRSASSHHLLSSARSGSTNLLSRGMSRNLSRHLSRANMSKVEEEDDLQEEDVLLQSMKISEKPVTPAAPVVNNAQKTSHWLLGPTLSIATDKYSRGDGVDIYIDKGMFLPDNTTLTRLTIRIYSASKEQLGQTYVSLSAPDSSCISPLFKFKCELRGNSLNHTSVMLIRMDTLDSSTLVPCSIGYACVKVFCTQNRTSCKSATDMNAYVNSGGFQLPVYGGRIPTDIPQFDDTMLSSLPRIPCASLLVRINPAPKSADGISVLSRDEFPRQEWVERGLDIPAPSYTTGSYMGALCEPSSAECEAYEAKVPLLSLTVESALTQAAAGRKTDSSTDPAPLPPRPLDPTPEALLKWLGGCLPPIDKMRRMLDYTLTLPYLIDGGVAVKVEGVAGLPTWGGKGVGGLFAAAKGGVLLYNVIMSTSPPGLFYKDPPLYDDVYYTRTHPLDTPPHIHTYTDGYVNLTPGEMAGGLCLIFEVRGVRIEKKRGDAGNGINIKVDSTGGKRNYWSFLPLSRERSAGGGYRYIQSGYFQLPLFEGGVPYGGVFTSPSPVKEVLRRLRARGGRGGVGSEGLVVPPIKLADGGFLVVKVVHPLLKDLVAPSLEGDGSTPLLPDTTFLTALVDAGSGREDKFKFDPVKHLPPYTNASRGGHAATLKDSLPALPDGFDLLKEVNEAFQKATGIKGSS